MDWWNLLAEDKKPSYSKKRAATHGISYSQRSPPPSSTSKPSPFPVRTNFRPFHISHNQDNTTNGSVDHTHEAAIQQLTAEEVKEDFVDVEDGLPPRLIAPSKIVSFEDRNTNEHIEETLKRRFQPLSASEEVILDDVERQTNTQFYEEVSRKYSSSAPSPRPQLSAHHLSHKDVDNLNATTADMSSTAHLRRHSVDSTDNVKAFQHHKRSIIRRVFYFLNQMLPKLQHRCNIYFAAFFILSLSAITDNFKHTHSWFLLYFVCIAVDLGTALVDNLLFMYYVDRIFSRHFEVAYLLHGFNGPVGLLGGIYIVHFFTKDFEATRTIPYWHKLLTASAIITVCMCVKNWYARKHYIRLIEKRFSEKVVKLETWAIMLSELASVRPPKVLRKPLKMNSVTFNTLKRMPGVLGDINKLHQKVIDVFADLVEATNHLHDENEEDIDMLSIIRDNTAAKAAEMQSHKTASSTSGRPPSGDTDTGSGSGSGKQDHNKSDDPMTKTEEIQPRNVADSNQSMFLKPSEDSSQRFDSESTKIRTFLRKRRNFWKLAARISANFGALKVFTYNGPVLISKKYQAKEFGRNLYTHLSRGGKLIVTHESLEKIFLEHNKKHLLPGNAEEEELAMRIQEHSSREDGVDRNDAMAFYQEALKMLDPFDLGYITPEQCIAAMIEIYKEQRFVASSLNDYGELHQSLRHVIDSVFWVVMALVIQAFLELNVFNYVIPFVTILLSVSFALAPLLGNLFLSITFVFFMVPYDIGNKVSIGQDPSLRVVGYIRSISLLHTTLNSIRNEVMKIPNHLLFHEYICNLSESGGCVFEIILTFNMDDSPHVDQSKIDAFFERIKQYTLVERKSEWKSCSVYGVALTPQDNVVTYSIWVEHRDNYQDISKPNNGRTELIKYMKQLMVEMGLKFSKIKQPVELSSALPFQPASLPQQTAAAVFHEEDVNISTTTNTLNMVPPHNELRKRASTTTNTPNV